MTTKLICKLPESLPDDFRQLKSLCEQFAQKSIEPSRFQSFRVPQGLYEQRESGSYMARARLVAGLVWPDQLRVFARIARERGDGQLHLTTRQDLQIHGVSLENIHPVVEALSVAGLSSKGGGGNTVRNIASCPRAGVCGDEVFDVTPHVASLTERLLNDPLSYQLPRKYKIAFSGCSQDCASATVNDLGFISKQRGDTQGFAIYVGGGMGARSSVGLPLEEWIPADQAARVAEAVKRVFDMHGDRKNRNNARIRFLIKDMGIDRFKDLYRAEFDNLSHLTASPTAENVPEVVLRQTESGATPLPLPTYERWRRNAVTAQKQDGYYAVEIAPALGLFDSASLEILADVAQCFGEGALRATNRQSFLLRWVREKELVGLHAALSAKRPDLVEPAALHNIIACAGASTCRLGMCLSRGLATAILHEASKSGIVLNDKLAKTTIRISGCPNSCGHHPIASIGFFGAARRVNGHLAPHYIVQFGGHVEEGITKLAQGSTTLPAFNIPRFLVELLKTVDEEGYQDFDDFLANGGIEIATEIAERFVEIPQFEDQPKAYSDWGSGEPFSLAGRGPGECGAGVFDLIDVDFATAKEAINHGNLHAATVASARSLLVTRGEQADTDSDALALFQKLFIEPGFISNKFKSLISIAHAASLSQNPASSFFVMREDVEDLLASVRALYASMGPSLRLPDPVKDSG